MKISVSGSNRVLSPSTIKSLLFFLTGAIFLILTVSPGWSDQEYVPGEIIIKLEPSKFTANNNVALSGKALKPLFQMPDQDSFRSLSIYGDLSNIYLVKVKEGTEIENCEIYTKMPGVVYAEPNYLQRLCVSPDDPDFVQQWSLPKIQAELAWDIQTGGSDVIVAVVDTGIDYLHEDLEANIWHNLGEIPDNGLDDDANGYIDDVIGWDFVDAAGGASYYKVHIFDAIGNRLGEFSTRTNSLLLPTDLLSNCGTFYWKVEAIREGEGENVNDIGSSATDFEGCVMFKVNSLCNLDGDGVISIIDIMKVAGRWDSFEGGEGYELIYDLDGDGDIDVVDIMKVAGRWGQE